MRKLADLSKIKTFLANVDGATAIEYALIGSLVSLATIGALQALGSDLGNMFDDVSGQF